MIAISVVTVDGALDWIDA